MGPPYHAQSLGIEVEDLEIVRFSKQYPDEFVRFKHRIESRNVASPDGKPVFPTRTSANPERREKRLAEELTEAPDKEYEIRDRNVRTTRPTIEPKIHLKSLYTNEDDHQMVCQICKEEMPFKKRDGEYYFEAVEALSRDHFPKEHEAQFLALCPVCAAMYKEFITGDEEAMVSIYDALSNATQPEIPVQLGEVNTSIRFVEVHFRDIKTIIGKMDSLDGHEDGFSANP